ncbi:hypothetical protein LBMAG54_05330 [Nitrosopumilaceae archaeon]|nr:sensor protein kinase WalK [Nitrosarchaeum sp.]GDY15677.1 hypothetical protein LBMAG54_05330 [Nitrosopumilaceae archaeon]
MNSKLSIQNIFLLILIGPSIAFSIIGLNIFTQLQDEESQDKLVENTRIVIETINNVQIDLLNAETGVRGFIIIGKQSFLEPYNNGINLINSNMDKLQKLTSDNQVQQQNISKLKILVFERLDILKKLIQEKESDNVDFALIFDGKQKMDEIRALLADMSNEENNLLYNRSSALDNSTQTINNLIAVGFTVIIIISILSISFLYVYIRKRTKVEFELKVQSEYLKKTDIQKSEFATMITHELKTPLVPITVYCKMLKSSMMGNLNKEQIDAINVIEKNAKSLDHLINDILDARKLDLKKLKFSPENVNIEEFFDEIYSAHNPVINQKGHKLVIDISDKHITIKTDKIRLRQVFDNLISNALKVMPEKNGMIEINMKKENDNIIFHVKDNGFGIPLDKQDEIFKKFYQVDTSARRKITGTGLGLAISKGITEQMGGKIWFESDGITGTTFFIQLPSV